MRLLASGIRVHWESLDRKFPDQYIGIYEFVSHKPGVSDVLLHITPALRMS
jgi:hypothetical protein